MITTKEPGPVNSFVAVQIFCLKLVMMWPIHSVHLWTTIFNYLYFYFLVVLFSMCTIGLFLKVTKTTDLVDRSEAIDIFTLVSSALYKMVYFAVKHKEIREIVNFADKNFKKTQFVGNNTFSIKKWMYWVTPLSIMHCSCGFLIISFWGICPLLKYLFSPVTLKEMSLPMNVWYPFEFNEGYAFGPLYFIHYICLITSVHVYMACDAFFFSLIHLTCGQIRLTQISLRGIEDTFGKGLIELWATLKRNGRCFSIGVDMDEYLLDFLQKLDELFRSMIVADVLHAIVSLSFAMLQTSESKGVLETFKMVAFVSYCFIHQCLNSSFGQALINKQEELSVDIYGTDWSHQSNSFMRCVHIMMSCSAKPVKFSAWRMYFLQSETFVEFCRSMVSFFMVLRTLRDMEV